MTGLLDRLRSPRVCSLARNSCHNDLTIKEAADRITALEAENARLRKAAFPIAHIDIWGSSEDDDDVVVSVDAIRRLRAALDTTEER
jgi:hypothetical protein